VCCWFEGEEKKMKSLVENKKADFVIRLKKNTIMIKRTLCLRTRERKRFGRKSF